jgi:hypothetical protein
MRVDDQKSRLKLELDLLKLKQSPGSGQHQRAKKNEDERVEPPKAIVLPEGPRKHSCADGICVDGELVKREEILLE